MAKVEGTLNELNIKNRSAEKEDDSNDLESVCLLFPTYATKNLDGQPTTDQWNIRVRGWAFCAPKKSKTRSLFLGLTALALQKDDERFQFLESRTSYFWANNISQGDFAVHIEGLTDSNKMSIEGDPNDEGTITTTVEPHGEGATTTTASVNVPDVKKVLDQAGKMISSPFHFDNEMPSVKITPKSGHFFGELSIPKHTVSKWIEENNSNVVSGFISNFIGNKDKDKVRLLKIKVQKDEGTDPHYGVVNLVEPEGVSIISDIDDTIKDTDILRGAKKVLSNTFLQPFKDVPGMADVYRNFYERGAAIHYVSNSPWQLFPSLRSFFQTYNFPPGSAHFKFYDGLIKSAYEQKENPMASKFMYIRELLKDFPKRKFILIGDTGELDPEIYTTIARENPGRILRIYVRDVTTEHVKDLPPEKPKHSYTRTFPTIYNYLRNYYSGDDEEDIKSQTADEKQAENAATHVITQQAAAATSGETTTEAFAHRTERKSTLTNRLLDKLHVDVSYLYGTAMESPEPNDGDSPKTLNKPKTPLSAKILSPDRAAAISSKFSKLRKNSKDDSKKEKTEDNNSDDDDDDDNDNEKDSEVLKTPLEMFHERLELLKEGLPDDLFHTFTDAKELEEDQVIKAELKL
ncbi:hypothetical protein C1645_730662 [Glomus cerebriforme]|uniref:Phosphatidate phosphatase APP1 catalytic domain-containing protein n=1 Tax=Glomus cerebriforme TaxID=658196 RepID=A0A397TY19_9GLOM|nr:hypothetical protein C1645_730662 [Glomus cerebriforme]